MDENTETELRAMERCRLHEGFRAHPYPCTENVWTIGWGHTDGVTADSPDITEVQGRDLFVGDWGEARSEMFNLLRQRRIQPASINDVRLCALVEMCFQLGPPHDFPAMLRAVRRRDWERAAAEMLYSDGSTRSGKRSDWWYETPDRCMRLAELVETGEDAW